jgi:hypothetical protein
VPSTYPLFFTDACRLSCGAESQQGPVEDEPSLPAPPDPVRRRLSLGGCTSPVDESDSVAASRSPTPDVVCSQYRLQQLEEGLLTSRYPTPPAAPPKDGYFAESEDESQSSLRQAPARVFRNGKLKIHKTYNGPVPLTYVDTGVYEGGGNDYYEVHTQEDLCWARRMNFVMKHHRIPRWNVE